MRDPYEIKMNAVNTFFEVLRAMLRLEIGDNPSCGDEQEAVNIAKYVQGCTAKAIEYWQEYHRMPLLQFTIFGGSDGRCMIDVYGVQDRHIQHEFKLVELLDGLMKASQEWEKKLPKDNTKLPEFKKVDIKFDAVKAWRNVNEIIDKEKK